MEKISEFLSETFQFLEAKFSIYLNKLNFSLREISLQRKTVNLSQFYILTYCVDTHKF